MENIPILRDLVIITAVSVPVAALFYRLGLSIIIGFLLTGAIIGPYGTGLVTRSAAVDTLAQIGVILLLFVIGLEFSLTRIMKFKRDGLLGGGLQVFITWLIIFCITVIIGHPHRLAALAGFAIALSSTAIVLKILSERAELTTPQGNLSLGILLFQDLCVVPMIIIIQSISGTQEFSVRSVIDTLVFSLVSLSLILGASYVIVPRLFHEVVKLKNREVFTLTVLLVCFGSAWISSLAGLSLAVGAFIAGLVISESPFSNQIAAEVVTYRDAMLGLFFISIGMMLDLGYFTQNFSVLLATASGILILKVLIITMICRLIGHPLRLSIMAGLALAQIGEFSFVIMKMGKDNGIISEPIYQTLLSSSVLTIAATPFLIQISQNIAYRISGLFGETARDIDKSPSPSISDHVIVIGYGLNGRNLAGALKETGIRHIVLDMSWDRIKAARKKGHKALFGDAGSEMILDKLCIKTARMLVIAISDPATTRRIVHIARTVNAGIYIIVRTRYIGEVEELYKIGANNVISEEFEASVEIFSRVLKEYHVPGNVIQNQVDLVRHEGYAMLRTPSIARDKLMEITSLLAESVLETFFVYKGSKIAGKTLAEINLRKKSGVMIIAVIRKAVTRTNPHSDFVVEEGDILAIIGSHMQMENAIKVLDGKIEKE